MIMIMHDAEDDDDDDDDDDDVQPIAYRRQKQAIQQQAFPSL